MSRVIVNIAVVVLSLPALAGCSVTFGGDDKPRDIDGDGRATFKDLHAARSDAGFPSYNETHDYGEDLHDHMERQNRDD